eukprot:TRINITY_DN6277_c0_g1_i1.p1 TRINITY_DN6277_c0_g1~~TRINITY_DN6277_c0_g1_i1.p1  ORF type:complete len:187 (+),score=36.18 TRINITY_DN6277_c0_g1_i1:23-583(+)
METFHEKQRLQLCGVHALNNLFRESKFSKQVLDGIAHRLKEQTAPGSLINPHKSIWGTGNYDANVIIAALHSVHAEVVWFDHRRDVHLIPLDLLFGIIVNSSTKRFFDLWKTRHWFALTPIDGVWYNADSNLDEPQMFPTTSQLLEFLDEHRKAEAEVLLVVTPDRLKEVESKLQHDLTSPIGEPV